MELRDIKDNTPNPELVSYLEQQLEHAKAGRLRTIVSVCGWSDDSYNNSWRLDHRNSMRRMLGEMAMLNFDMLTNIAIKDGDTVLSRIT